MKKGVIFQNWNIIIKAWQDKNEERKINIPLSRERLKNIYCYLIEMNLGNQVYEMKIKQNDTLIKNKVRKGNPGRVDLIIVGNIPDQDWLTLHESESDPVYSEADTILTGAKGSLIKIQAGSFYPEKISDYRFEIKEIFTREEMISNNISTVTTDGKVINSAGILGFYAIPKDSTKNLPEKLLKPADIFIPVNNDSVTETEFSVYQKTRGNRPSCMWKNTHLNWKYVNYKEERYLVCTTAQSGYVMAGELTAYCNKCTIKTPSYSEQNYHLIYTNQNSVIFFHGKNNRWMTFACPGENNIIKISGYANDDSGNVFGLVMNECRFSSTKSHYNILKIKKHDYYKF